MDTNRLTEQQQPRSPLGEQRRRPASPQSNTAGAETSLNLSDAFILFPEPGTRNNITQSPVPAPITSNREYDVEARLTSSPLLIPISPQRVAAPDIPNTASTNTATSSYEVTPLPPAMVSSRRSTILADNNANRTHHNTHNIPGSTIVPPMLELRKTPSGPDHTLDHSSTMTRTGTGTEIPTDEKTLYREKTVEQRLHDTLKVAGTEKDKCAKKAQLTGYALNIAIGLQVLFGSLTTALSVVTKGSQTAVMTAVLGGFSTVVAAYLARARGSNEPELSIRRAKDLEQFIRECNGFICDHGHATGERFNEEVERFRRRFEMLLGNANGDSEKKSTV